MLTSIELTGFRGFHQLKLEGLQRVNLIVGKNNSGKTSLLEGIELLGEKGHTLGARGQKSAELRMDLDEIKRPENWKWYINDFTAQIAELAAFGFDQTFNRVIDLDPVRSQQNLRQRNGNNPKSSQLKISPTFPVVTMPIHQKSPQQLTISLGNALKIKGAEELIETTLRRVDERIQKVRMITDQTGTHVFVDIGLPELAPVSMVGQGIFRLLDIYSEIIGSKAKVCLIDEIENGIHHASLIDFWRGLAEASVRFDVQIFVTTHSHECIQAAHEAFSERDSYDLSVIQLFRKTISVQGRVLDQTHIAAAIAGDIDLRGQ